MKEINLKVEGMACTGCENRIQNSLKTIDGVESVIANHKLGTVNINLNKEIDNSILITRIEDLGFNVVKEN